MSYLRAIRSVIARQRAPIALALVLLVLGLGVRIWLWKLVPPVPRASWSAQGQNLFFSADGRLLATLEMTWRPQQLPPGWLGSGGGPPPPDKCQVHVYDVASGAETAVLTWDDVEVRSLALSPDGRRLAAMSLWRGDIREWETATGRELAFFRVEDVGIEKPLPCQVVYSPAGELLALVREEEGGWFLWDCRRRHVVAPLASKDDFAPPDSTVPGFLLASTKQDTLKVWRLDTGELTGVFARLPHGFCYPPNATLSTDGKLLLWGSRDGVKIEEANGTCRWLAPLNAEHSPVLSPDNRLLVVFAWHDLRRRQPSFMKRAGLAAPPQNWTSLTLYDLSDGRELAVFPGGRARFSPDGQSLAVLCEDGTVQLWDVPPRRPGGKITGYVALAVGTAFLAGCLIKGLTRRCT